MGAAGRRGHSPDADLWLYISRSRIITCFCNNVGMRGGVESRSLVSCFCSLVFLLLFFLNTADVTVLGMEIGDPTLNRVFTPLIFHSTHIFFCLLYKINK